MTLCIFACGAFEVSPQTGPGQRLRRPGHSAHEDLNSGIRKHNQCALTNGGSHHRIGLFSGQPRGQNSRTMLGCLKDPARDHRPRPAPALKKRKRRRPPKMLAKFPAANRNGHCYQRFTHRRILPISTPRRPDRSPKKTARHQTGAPRVRQHRSTRQGAGRLSGPTCFPAVLQNSGSHAMLGNAPELSMCAVWSLLPLAGNGACGHRGYRHDCSMAGNAGGRLYRKIHAPAPVTQWTRPCRKARRSLRVPRRHQQLPHPARQTPPVRRLPKRMDIRRLAEPVSGSGDAPVHLRRF